LVCFPPAQIREASNFFFGHGTNRIGSTILIAEKLSEWLQPLAMVAKIISLDRNFMRAKVNLGIV